MTTLPSPETTVLYGRTVLGTGRPASSGPTWLTRSSSEARAFARSTARGKTRRVPTPQSFRLFRAYLAGEAPVIHGDGLQSRDFTFVDDAVSANLLAAAAPDEACGRAYKVGGGRRTTVRELARSVREAAGEGPEPLAAPPRAGDMLHSLADLTCVREVISYLSRGLARSLEHYARSAGPGSVRALPEKAAR